MKKKITGKKSDPGEGLFDAKKVFLKGVSAVIDQVNEPDDVARECYVYKIDQIVV